MKSKLRIIFVLLFLVIGFNSCDKNNIDTQKVDTNEILLSEISSENKSIIIKEIEHVFKNENIKVVELTKVEKFNNFYIVSFKTNVGDTRDIAFEDLFGDKDNYSKIESIAWSVYCTGNCDCRLEGVPEVEEFAIQCSCNDCVLNYSSKYKEKRIDELMKEYDILDLAQKSFKNTFKSSSNDLEIVNVEFEQYKNVYHHIF